MGRVWIAEHLKLDTNVVVKFMSKDVAATADGAARFSREASVAAAVKSPHVVQVFDHGVTPDGDAYIVMELLEGRDLGAHLSSQGPMAPREVAALVAQVAKALGRAHKVGVVHRDIKPENIFLCESDAGELFVKLLDFGIAKRDQHAVAGAATTTGAVVGTPYYMSPEQIVGEKEIDARTDIWSLGVVAFEALVGKRPFDGATVGAITLAIHTSTPRIADHLPDASALDAWFAHACSRNANARFQTAREASEALLLAVGELPPSTSRLRPPMPSMVGDGSDPSLAARASGSNDTPSDGPAATHLSSVFPVPHPSRARPTLVVAILAIAVVLVGAIVVVPPLLRRHAEPESSPSAGALHAAPAVLTPSSATSPSSAPSLAGTDMPATEDPSSTATGPVFSATRAAAPPPSAARATAPAGSRTSGSGATTPPPPRTPGRNTKPSRTRDDDDIK
jgi:serine/threonine-protein kinase